MLKKKKLNGTVKRILDNRESIGAVTSPFISEQHHEHCTLSNEIHTILFSDNSKYKLNLIKTIINKATKATTLQPVKQIKQNSCSYSMASIKYTNTNNYKAARAHIILKKNLLDTCRSRFSSK